MEQKKIKKEKTKNAKSAKSENPKAPQVMEEMHLPVLTISDSPYHLDKRAAVLTEYINQVLLMEKLYLTAPELPDMNIVARAKVSHDLNLAEVRYTIKADGENTVEGICCAIFNKISKDTYSDLSLDFITTCVKKEADLGLIVNLLVERAIADDNSVIFAHLCYKTITYCRPTHPELSRKFSTLLLTECQTLYYTEFGGSATDVEQSQKHYKQHINLSIFLSYLMKITVVPQKLVVMLIDDIINNVDETGVENLCAILPITASQLITVPEAEPTILAAHSMLQKIVATDDLRAKYQSRVIFLIKDILDLEAVDWNVSETKSKVKDHLNLLSELQAGIPQITEDEMRHNLHYSRSEFVRNVYDEEENNDNEWIEIGAKKNNKSKKNMKKHKRTKTDKKTKKTEIIDAPLNEDEAKLLISNGITAYLDSTNITSLAVLSTKNPNYKKTIVRDILLLGCEKDKKISQLEVLLVEIGKAGIIKPDDYLDGIKLFLEQYPDLSVDIPRIHDFASELLTRSICEGCISPVWFTPENIKQSGLNSELCEKFINELKDHVTFTNESIHLGI